MSSLTIPPVDSTARATADAALPKAGGTLTGNVATSAGVTIDGYDVSVVGSTTNSAIPSTTFSDTLPISVDMKSTTETARTGSLYGWISSIGSVGAGSPSTCGTDSAGRVICQWDAGNPTGSGNLQTTGTSEKGFMLVTRWRESWVPLSGYVEMATTFTLDSGQANRVATGTYQAGIIIKATPTNATDLGTVHNYMMVVSFTLNDVACVLRKTISGTTTSVASATGLTLDLVVGIDLKLRLDHQGLLTAYYRQTGGGAYTTLGSVSILKAVPSHVGLFASNNAGTLSVLGNMTNRLTALGLTRTIV